MNPTRGRGQETQARKWERRVATKKLTTQNRLLATETGRSSRRVFAANVLILHEF
jgi:hypothetical protein